PDCGGIKLLAGIGCDSLTKPPFPGDRAMSTTRRHFLLTAGAATLAATAAADAPKDANSRLRVALVGLGGRANAHLKCLLGLAGDNVELAALCDADATLLGQRAAEVERQTRKKPI